LISTQSFTPGAASLGTTFRGEASGPGVGGGGDMPPGSQ
jgi:hypothetical protein